jgi:hypothetical protein
MMLIALIITSVSIALFSGARMSMGRALRTVAKACGISIFWSVRISE